MRQNLVHLSQNKKERLKGRSFGVYFVSRGKSTIHLQQ